MLTSESVNLSTKLAIIMRGLPGSGKSHWVAQFIQSQEESLAKAIWRHGYFSTDALFVEKGHYRFNAARLSEYHQRNLTLFIQALAQSQPVVICDNTNMARWEFMAYEAAAKALGYQVREVLIGDPLDEAHQIVCAKRNQHGVSLSNIEAMARKFDPF